MRGVSAGKPAQITGAFAWNTCFARKFAQKGRTHEAFLRESSRSLRADLHGMCISPVNPWRRGELTRCFQGGICVDYGRFCMECVFRP